MASQHHPIKNGSRGNGGKHAQYIAGAGAYGRTDVIHCEDGNLPKWAENSEEFFKAADEYERGNYTRKLTSKEGIQYEKMIKGRAYKELEVAIPREAKDPIKWAKEFARESIGTKHPYRMGIHDKLASDGGRNVHMHLMFSTRTMDGHDRSKEQFFKRAAAPYKHRKTGEIVQPDPSKGGAKKSAYWDSREAVLAHKDRFERHVQRVAPDFKLERSDAPEPKIGPILENPSKEYETGRAERAESVAELRTAKKARAEVDKEISIELAREKEAEKPRSRTDDLWAQLGTPKQTIERPAERYGHADDSDSTAAIQFADFYGGNASKPSARPEERHSHIKDSDIEEAIKFYGGAWGSPQSAPKPAHQDMSNVANKPLPETPKAAHDWSQFRSFAGAKAEPLPTQPEGDKAVYPPSTGPGYFPETIEERQRNEEAAAGGRLLREQDSTRTDELWERMERERQEQERRERDSGPDMPGF